MDFVEFELIIFLMDFAEFELIIECLKDWKVNKIIWSIKNVCIEAELSYGDKWEYFIMFKQLNKKHAVFAVI